MDYETLGQIFNICLLVFAFLVMSQFVGVIDTLQIYACLLLYFFIPHKQLFAVILTLIFIPSFLKEEVNLKGWSLDSRVHEFVECSSLASLGLKRGDAIEFERSSYEGSNWYVANLFRQYAHWGIYASDDTVYHWVNTGSPVDGNNPDCILNLFKTPMARVVRGSLIEAAQGGKCRINNLEILAKHLGLERLPESEILRRARELMSSTQFEETKEYHAVKANCEHFVTYCLFGKPVSAQTEAIYKYYGRKLKVLFVQLFVVYRAILFLSQIGFIREYMRSIYYNPTFQSEAVRFLNWLEQFILSNSQLLYWIGVPGAAFLISNWLFVFENKADYLVFVVYTGSVMTSVQIFYWLGWW